MPRIDFAGMPDEARVWSFGIERPLTEDERTEFLDTIDEFLVNWKAHGTPLTAARDFRHDRFLLVAVDERTAPPSGCSIDALVRVLRHEESRLGTRIVDNTPVWYLGPDGVERVDRPTFRSRAAEGRVSPDTVVFDTTVTRVRQVREGTWEAPAAKTWHGRAFFRELLGD